MLIISNKLNIFRCLVVKKVKYVNTELYVLHVGSFNSCVYEKAKGSIAFSNFAVYEYILLILAVERAVKIK